MEEDSRPAPPDLAEAEACGNELTRTDSGSSSVTVDISKDFVRTKNVARPSTAWTNAKHNSYLASLEASFIKELHQSLGLRSSHSEYSDQFTVLQDGFSRRINFERSQPLPYNAAGSHFVKESSWMQRFRCSGKHNNISVNLQECSTFCSEEMLSGRKRIFTHRLSISGRPCICHESQQDAVGNIAEVSDQNFVDEDQEEKSLSLSRPKRLKMDAADSSTNDQIVPSGDMFSVEIATAGYNLLERKEQVDRKCHSDNIDSLFAQDVM
ncbi:hypothetical protein RHGRI_032662 [Rhododendron griersonianum]|uniref:Uncharacterized protein n=1 Tax=Rhododendron griersonianum TaxID=479676 RepID=A0AAV6ICV1_9ERIC|nr:hypothetical protein RHGRI_032662 [Rhododendron griersonianum]